MTGQDQVETTTKLSKRPSALSISPTRLFSRKHHSSQGSPASRSPSPTKRATAPIPNGFGSTPSTPTKARLSGSESAPLSPRSITKRISKLLASPAASPSLQATHEPDGSLFCESPPSSPTHNDPLRTPVPRSPALLPPVNDMAAFPSMSKAGIDEGGLLSVKIVDGRGFKVGQVEKKGASVPFPRAGGHRKTDSVLRQEAVHLPFVLIKFDQNEVVVDALGGSYEAPTFLYATIFDVSKVSDGEVRVAAFLRSGADAPPQLLGGLKFTPEIEPGVVSDSWYPLSNGSGEIRLQVGFRPSTHEPLCIENFELLKLLGKGSFGKVVQCRKKDTNRIYAIKTIRKSHIISRNEVTHTLAERSVLAKVKSPFITPLKFSFQSQEKLFLVLAFINGGELFQHLQNEGSFSEPRSRLYTAELLSALDHLHSFDIIYRDLKPENILIDYEGHIMLCDFGLSKLDMKADDRTTTFAGTPEYLAPEILKGEAYSRLVDWWTLGILTFEMLSGLPPFYDEVHEVMYKRIVTEKLSFPSTIANPVARDLLIKLLNKDPEQRLGAGGADEIRQHAFFADISWEQLEARAIEPCWRPSVSSAIDTSNVDPAFTSQPVMDSVVEEGVLSESAQALFSGFSYTRPSDMMGESVR